VNTDVLGYTREELDARGALKTACEIWQQPDLWREVAAAAAARREETQAFLHPLLERPGLRIVLTGAGTSAFAGEVLAPALTRVLRRRVDAMPTTDIVSNARECFAENLPTLVVSFARSGDSPESVAATELAEQCLDEVRHLVITCNAEGELYRRHRAAEGSLVLLMPERANDEGFAMTSSFTCMLLTAWLTLTPPDLDAGARVERINPLADISDKGARESATLMVNYLYDPGRIEEYHEDYAGEGKRNASTAVRKLARGWI